MHFWQRLFANNLKNRLFAAFVIMLLLPYTLLSIYNFQEVEQLMRNKISEQDRENLDSVKQSLENMMGVVTKTATLLERDLSVTFRDFFMRFPEQYDDWERTKTIENKFQSISNSFFLSGTQVFYTVVDFDNHVYTSYLPETMLDYEQLKKQPWFQEYQSSDAKYQWNTNDPNYVSRDITRSPYFISLYTTLKDDNLRPIGIARISIDYMQWFKTITNSSKNLQNYFIVNKDGTVIQQSDPDSSLMPAVIGKLTNSNESSSLFLSEDPQSLYNFSYLPTLQWYIVKKVPLDILYSEVNLQKKKYFTTLLVISIAFMLMTFWITTAITRPLKHLQKKMESIAATDLKMMLPEQRGTEEIEALSRSFNRMIQDMNALIERLKMEERQRQAVRFQVLLSQMDPHFLLNTLNTIKCIALRKDDEETHEICVSLGKLLELSLNLEVDMIYLKDEIEMVQAYMHIQNSRYGHKFKIEYVYEEALNYALVLKATLQPLVENAIYHGFSTRHEGSIVIRVYSNDKVNLILEIVDNGVGIDKANEQKVYRKRKGIGLKNIRERLELLFQDRAGLELIPMDQGTMVRLHIPLLLSTPYFREDIHHVVDADR